MRVLFLGDIMGASGRDVVVKYASILRQQYKLDAIIANAENATHGFGLSAKHAEHLLAHDIDILTGGNHSFDKPSLLDIIPKNPRILCPHNYADTMEVSGVFEGYIGSYKIKVINILGTVFMKNNVNPFNFINDYIGSSYPKKNGLDAIIVDIHGETTSEKYALGHMLDGRVSLVVGTHTHIPTNDTHILPQGTAIQADAGMCGDYDSVIGIKKNIIIQRFMDTNDRTRMDVAGGEATLCGNIIETHPGTGLASTIYPIIIGPHLHPATPPLP